MADNYQRVGAISNAHVGRDFEAVAMVLFAKRGILLERDIAVEVGVGNVQKSHRFDLGSLSPPVLVECKSHRWTSGGKVPNAKMTIWNEAMYYFHCAPPKFRKILFVLRDVRRATGETLSSYYIRIYGHLIPEDVEIWEFNEESSECLVVHGSSKDIA